MWNITKFLPKRSTKWMLLKKALYCICLRWSRTNSEFGSLSVKKIGLEPVESFIGKVHIFRIDRHCRHLQENDSYQKRYDRLRKGKIGYVCHMFYENRLHFFRDIQRQMVVKYQRNIEIAVKLSMELRFCDRVYLLSHHYRWTTPNCVYV